MQTTIYFDNLLTVLLEYINLFLVTILKLEYLLVFPECLFTKCQNFMHYAKNYSSVITSLLAYVCKIQSVCYIEVKVKKQRR